MEAVFRATVCLFLTVSLCVLGPVHVLSQECHPTACGCRDVANGVMVDLAAAQLNRKFIRNESSETGFEYILGLCGTTSCSDANITACAVNQTANTTTSYGSLDNVTYTILNPNATANVSVNITFVDSNRTTLVKLVCSYSAANDTSVLLISAKSTILEFSIYTNLSCLNVTIQPTSTTATPTPSPSPNMTTTFPNMTTTSPNMTSPPPSNMTITPPPSNMTSLPPSNMTSLPPSNMTITPPPSNMTSLPPSNMTSLPPSNMTITPPPSNMTSLPPSNMTSLPPSNMTITPPPSNMTITPPPSNMTSLPPSNMTSLPPSNMTIIPPPSNMTITPPPSSMTSTPMSSPTPSNPSQHCPSKRCADCGDQLGIALGVSIPGTAILTFLITILTCFFLQKVRNKRSYTRLGPTVNFDDEDRD